LFEKETRVIDFIFENRLIEKERKRKEKEIEKKIVSQ